MSMADGAKLYIKMAGKLIPLEKANISDVDVYRQLTPQRLRGLLQKAIDREDYEDANIINKVIAEKVK